MATGWNQQFRDLPYKHFKLVCGTQRGTGGKEACTQSSLRWRLLECLVGCGPLAFRRHGCRGCLLTWYLGIVRWPAHRHSGQVLENPQGLTPWSSLSAFLLLTSHLPDGSHWNKHLILLRNPERGGGVVLSLAVVVGPAGLGGKGVTGGRQKGVS